MSNPTPVSGRKVTRADFNALGAAVAALESTPPGEVTADSPSLIAIGNDGSRKDVRFVTPQMFGAVGDGVTDDGAAFVAAIAYLKSSATGSSGDWYRGSHKLYVPQGHYYLGTTTLDITHTVTIEGEHGYGPQPTTKLEWADGTTGIRCQYYNTSGAGDVDETPGGSAGGTLLRNLFLLGGYDGTEGEHHGIHIKVCVFVENCWIANFSGDGIYINASAGLGAPNEGNANNCGVSRVRVVGCRNGVYINGDDANAGYFERIDVSSNRRWGVWDSSFLGNTHIGHHALDNGLVPDTIPTMVSYNGNRYAVVAEQGAGASVNAPSGDTTDTGYWIYISAGDAHPFLNIPDWFSGIEVRDGGCFKTDNANGKTVFMNCYAESGAPAQTASGTLVIGGNTGNKGGGAWISGYDGQAVLRDVLIAGIINFEVGGVSVARIVPSQGYGLVFDASAGKNIYANVNNATIWETDSSGVLLNTGKVLKVNGTQVVGAQGAAVADATGGGTTDTEARAAINALLARCRAHGLIAS